MKKNLLNLFIDKLIEFPLWIKQVIFVKLYGDLQSLLSDSFMEKNRNNLYHLYVPVISYIGQKELEEREKGFDDNLYNFLEYISEGFSIIEIALNNFWTMEEVSKLFIFAMEQDLIKAPIPVEISTMAGFIAGKYRTGEYFKRIGKINVDQLEQTLIRQKELCESGQKSRIAEVMISLGFITEKDTKSLIIIKEEAKKRFILDLSIIPKGTVEENSLDKDELERLTQENKVLKEKLNKLLSFFKQNQKTNVQ